MEKEKIKFDLFKLHNSEEDLGARSFIRFRGKKLYSKLEPILRQIIKKDIDIISLSEDIAFSLKCCKDTIRKILKDKTKNGWIAIPILIEVLNRWKLMCNKSEEEFNLKRLEIQDFVKEISTGVSIVKVKAIKSLNIDLAFLAGAHHADGHLAKEFSVNGCSYRLQFVDHYKSSLEILKNKLYDTFGVKVNIKKDRCNAWEIYLKSKVIGRYFEKILGFPAGNKINFNMPKIIKNATLDIKKAYVRGFLTFDGSVETDRNVSIGIKNEILRDEIYEIISLYLSIKKRRVGNTYHFRSGIPNLEQIRQWQDFFEKGTEKWFKLNDYLKGFVRKVSNKRYAIRILGEIFEESNSNKITIVDVIKTLEELKCCDKFYLARRLNIAVSTLYRYFHILEKVGILKKTNKPLIFPNILFKEDPRIKLTKETHQKFFSIIEKRCNIKEVCNKFKICDTTYRNWRNNKNNISLNKLQKICKYLKFKLDVRDIESFNKKLLTFNNNYKEWLVPDRPWF